MYILVERNYCSIYDVLLVTIVPIMKIDAIDRKILSHIQLDASLSVGMLSEKVSLSKTACWRRLNKLQDEGVIKQRVTLLDSKSLNLSLMVYISVRTNQHSQKWNTKFTKVVTSIPEILEVNRMSGDLDYLLKAVVSNMTGYDKLYKKLVQADIFDISSSFVMEEIKATTELPLDFITN